MVISDAFQKIPVVDLLNKLWNPLVLGGPNNRIK